MVAVTTGFFSSCALDTGGHAYCWGYMHGGPVSSGTRTPILVLGENPVFDRIVTGTQVTCGVRAGVAYCWGVGEKGALGDGTQSEFRPAVGPPVASLTDIVDLDVGAGNGLAFVCAARSNGTVWCWGPDHNHQLGDGKVQRDTCGPTPCSRTPVQVVGINDGIKVTTGSVHACALSASGTVSCWGVNYDGQLGDGLKHEECPGVGDCSPVPVRVAGLTDAVAISAGATHTCAIREEGHSIVCWGNNAEAQLGTGTVEAVPDYFAPHQPTPTFVVGLDKPDPPFFIPGGVTRAENSQSCVWDGTTQRRKLDCTSDLYTYTAPSCQMEWTQCETSDVWRVNCGADGNNFKCECFANGHSVGTVGLAIDPCEPRSAPVYDPGPRVYGRMIDIAAHCPFCANPT